MGSPPPPSSICKSYTNLVAARVTALDRCGRVKYGDQSSCVFDGFSSATFTFEMSEGAEIEKKKASGQICVSRKLRDTLKYVQNEFTFCELDSAFLAIANPNWPSVVDYQGNTTGFRISTADVPQDANIGGCALELWAEVETSGGADPCDDPNASGAWEYILIPWMDLGGTIGDLEFSEEGADFVFSQRSRTNSRWGVGPYDVTRNADGDPGPLLTPIGPKEPIHFETVTVPPPTVQCGFQPVVAPVLPAPANLASDASALTDTSAKVTWDAVPGADSYDVEIAEA